MILISFIGPRQGGKTTLIKSIVEHFTNIDKWPNSNLTSISSSNEEIVILAENISDSFSALNFLKFSDIIVSVVNGFFGLELETFETTTIIKNSNLNRFIFVLTHLDLFKTWKSLKKAKKRIKDRLVQEANGNCKIFYCSGLKNNNGYFSGEIKNLTRYLNKIKTQMMTTQKIRDFTVITKIKFQKTMKKDIAFLVGYTNSKTSFEKENKKCFIPGIGKVPILKANGLPVESNLLWKDDRDDNNHLNLDLKYRLFTSKNKNHFDFQKRFVINRFLFYISNLKCLNYKKNKKPLTLFLIDSNRIFNSYTVSKNSFFSAKLLSGFQKILTTKKSNTFSPSFNLTSTKSSFYQVNTNKAGKFSTERKMVITITQIPMPFKRYHDAYNLLMAFFVDEEKKKVIVGKIIKNKWEKEVLKSGKIYLASVGFKIICTKLYFCNMKSPRSFCIQNNLHHNEFSYIVFYADNIEAGESIIGIKTKSQTRKALNQGTCFFLLFTGSAVGLKIKFKMFKRIKLKGVIFKKFQKTALIKNMFSSVIDAVKYKGAFIKTQDGIRGIIKNPRYINSQGIIRATFEKKIQKLSPVSLITFVKINIPERSDEIYFNLIPIDQQELIY